MPTTLPGQQLETEMFSALVDSIARPRSLRQIMASFYAPVFDAVERNGRVDPEPSLRDVIEAGEKAIAWFEAEIAKGCDESLTRHHQDRIAYIKGELAALSREHRAAAE